MKQSLLLASVLLAGCVRLDVDIPRPKSEWVAPKPPPPPPPPPPPVNPPQDDEPDAGTSHLPGGNSFDAARSITLVKNEDGTLGATWTVKLTNEKQYYTFEGKPGWRIDLRAVGNVNSCDIDLFDDARKSVERESAQKNCELLWLPGAGQEHYTYYIAQRSSWKNVVATVTLRLTDCTDSGGLDAGHDFDSAMELPSKDFTGWIAGDSNPIEGTDRVDLYKFTVGNDDHIKIRVTPSSKTRLELTVFDGERKKREGDLGNNQGQIVKINWKPKYAGTAYLKISVKGSSSGGEYKVEREK